MSEAFVNPATIKNIPINKKKNPLLTQLII